MILLRSLRHACVLSLPVPSPLHALPARLPRAQEAAKMNMMVTHRKLLDLAKAQTREIELMREELVRLRARTFPSFAQIFDNQRSLQDVRD